MAETAQRRETRSKRVGISLTPSDKAELDVRAKEAGMAPSMLASVVVRAYLHDPDLILPGMRNNQN